MLTQVLGKVHPKTEGPGGRGVEHHLALPRSVFGMGEPIHERTRQDVDELDLGITHDEPAGVAGSNRDFESEPELATGRRHPDTHRAHDVLHRKACLLYTSPSPRDGLLSR